MYIQTLKENWRVAQCLFESHVRMTTTIQTHISWSFLGTVSKCWLIYPVYIGYKKQTFYAQLLLTTFKFTWAQNIHNAMVCRHLSCVVRRASTLYISSELAYFIKSTVCGWPINVVHTIPCDFISRSRGPKQGLDKTFFQKYSALKSQDANIFVLSLEVLYLYALWIRMTPA